VGIRPLVFVVALLLTSSCANSAITNPWERRLTAPLSTDGVTDPWWTEDSPCPEGSKLRGAAPPKALLVWCANDIGSAHGRWTEWHRNGAVKADGAYEDGKRHGAWTEWTPSGYFVETTWEHGAPPMSADVGFVDVTVRDRTFRRVIGGAQVGVSCDSTTNPPNGAGVTDASGQVRLGPLEPDRCTLYVLSGSGQAVTQLRVVPGTTPVEVLVQ
jgi:hypothetical protein